jgi:hypothetical protein
MFKTARTGTRDACGEILAFGDRALGSGCTDPELVADLVLVARRRVEMFDLAILEWSRSG